jgi:hypothetical protein
MNQVSLLCQITLEHQYVSYLLSGLPLAQQGGISDQRRMVRAVIRQSGD